MNRIKNTVLSILNVLVIAGILLFIIAGLVKIGILEVPGFIKELVGDGTQQSEEHTGNNSGFLSGDGEGTEYTFEKASLTSESVKELLSKLTPSDEYSKDVHFTVHAGENSVTNRVFLMKKNDVYCAFYLSGDGNAYRQIVRNKNRTVINTIEDGVFKSAYYNNGDIDFSAETGVILTHDDFFEAADDPGYTFSLRSDEHGAIMLIEFVSVMGEYSQLQKYTLNLDYGIVTEAKCYENDTLIYEMYTDSLSDNSIPGFVIPKEFKTYLPTGFMPTTAD